MPTSNCGVYLRLSYAIMYISRSDLKNHGKYLQIIYTIVLNTGSDRRLPEPNQVWFGAMDRFATLLDFISLIFYKTGLIHYYTRNARSGSVHRAWESRKKKFFTQCDLILSLNCQAIIACVAILNRKELTFTVQLKEL